MNALVSKDAIPVAALVGNFLSCVEYSCRALGTLSQRCPRLGVLHLWLLSASIGRLSWAMGGLRTSHKQRPRKHEKTCSDLQHANHDIAETGLSRQDAATQVTQACLSELSELECAHKESIDLDIEVGRKADEATVAEEELAKLKLQLRQSEEERSIAHFGLDYLRRQVAMAREQDLVRSNGTSRQQPTVRESDEGGASESSWLEITENDVLLANFAGISIKNAKQEPCCFVSKSTFRTEHPEVFISGSELYQAARSPRRTAPSSK